MDLDAAEAAGIRDAVGRASLLNYLEAEGFTLAEMVEAERRGRLFALAGDALIRSGPPEHSLRSAAASLDVPFENVVHAWSALGLTVSEPDSLALSDADVEGLRTWRDINYALGEETSSGLLRVLGSSMARLAEAESSAIRGTVPDVQLNYTEDEARTAKAFAAIGELVPRIGQLIDVIHRQHIQSARTYFEQIVYDTSSEVMVGVGFADLSGFTALTERLTLGELSGVLTAFGSAATDVVHEYGGRVVKLLGDAVMWVNVDANHLAEVAHRLVMHPAAAQAGIQVRAGLAYGPVLALEGDYFGSSVNLAARLVANADPGQILAAAHVTDQLTGWASEALEPVTLRGFDDPVTPYSIRPAV